jgi:organic radical activating enzyme
MKDLKNVTFETNATQKLQSPFKDYLNNQERFTVTWSCSPKLSVSGESQTDAIKPGIVADYAGVNNSELYLKFVVADSMDVDEVADAVQAYRDADVECPVYCMPLGGRSEEYTLNVQQVAELCMERGWRFTPRLHISLFGNAWGT